jgi:hypothetical protein
MAGKDMTRYYRHRANKLRQPPNQHRPLYANTEPPIAKIGGRGLGVRSWQWGLRAMGAGGSTSRKPIAGVIETFTIYGKNNAGRMRAEDVAGYALRNKLSYIQAAMPAGWEQAVEHNAVNRVLGIARNALRTEWARAMGTTRKVAATLSNRKLADYFKEMRAA